MSSFHERTRSILSWKHIKIRMLFIQNLSLLSVKNVFSLCKHCSSFNLIWILIQNMTPKMTWKWSLMPFSIDEIANDSFLCFFFFFKFVPLLCVNGFRLRNSVQWMKCIHSLLVEDTRILVTNVAIWAAALKCQTTFYSNEVDFVVSFRFLTAICYAPPFVLCNTHTHRHVRPKPHTHTHTYECTQTNPTEGGIERLRSQHFMAKLFWAFFGRSIACKCV